MPVRRLNERVMRWPDAESVLRAFKRWAEDAAQDRGDVLRVGYFGSLARGGWGVGSDLDAVVVLTGSELPFLTRRVEWDTKAIPVPVDLLVYTPDEWRRVSDRFAREVVWVLDRR